MGAIDNSNLLNYRADNGTSGFSPAITFAYDAGAHEVDFTDASTFPSGVSLLLAHVRVHDKFGGEVRGYIRPVSGSNSGHDGTVTVSTASLDASKGLDVSATVLGSDRKLTADGAAYNIAATGSVAGWDKQSNAQHEV